MNIRTFKLLVILSASLFVFVFLSGTIYMHSLPRVAVTLPGEGSIRHHHRVAGEIISVYDAVQNELQMSLNPNESQLQAIFSLPNDIDFVEVGQLVDLSIGSRQNITGVVESLRLYSSHFEAYVSFEYLEAQAGESAEAIFEHISPVHERVLPNSAIQEAWWVPPLGSTARTQPVYVAMVVERERGLFGYIYSIRQVPVRIIEEGLSQTAVQSTFPYDAEVVTGSTGPLANGTRVRLVVN